MSIQELLSDQLIARCAYDVNGNPEYLGDAPPGSGGEEAEWRIRKFLYDGNGRWTATLFANGNAGYDKVWDQRVSYSYG